MPPVEPATPSGLIPIPTLVGKSNFTTWHSTMLPILSSNRQAHALISGQNWCESPTPTSPVFLNHSQAPPATTPAAAPAISDHPILLPIDCILASATIADPDRANLLLSRFIRGTLALNVLPFVRQHTTARALWESLVDLYGVNAGIDRIGGPAALDRGFGMGQRSQHKPELKSSDSYS